MSKKIGITGTIGSGKSLVGQILKDLGYPCLDTDKVNSELFNDQLVQIELINAFGSEVVEAGIVQRDVLRNAIFNSQQAKLQLEQILHPKIKAGVNNFLELDAPLLFVEVPLLYEVGWEHLFDEVWCVTSSDEIVLERLTNIRKISLEQAQNFLNLQYPKAKKVAKSDVIIINDGSILELTNQLKELISTYE